MENILCVCIFSVFIFNICIFCPQNLFQGASSHRERGSRHRHWSQQSGQGAESAERRPQVVGHDLRPGQLQDGALQEAAQTLPARLRVPAVPQQQGQAEKSQEVQIQVSWAGPYPAGSAVWGTTCTHYLQWLHALAHPRSLPELISWEDRGQSCDNLGELTH